MKNLLVLTRCFLLIIIVSCSKDDTGPSYAFIDQNLQGTINGKAFIFGNGVASESVFEEDYFTFHLYHKDEEYDEICNFFGGDKTRILFSSPAEVGLYELSFGIDAQSVTLSDPEETLFIAVTEGAIEILSISDTEITGRLDARFDGDSQVNGNFTLQVCTDD